MIYVDTSFLFALFVEQEQSARATRWIKKDDRQLWTSSFGLFEFEQALRFQAFLFKHDRSRGLPARSVRLALNHMRALVAEGVFMECDYHWHEVLKGALRLASEHTDSKGCRSMDIIHVALALHMGSREFLTFDSHRRKLAEAEGLTVPL
jgi:predicted nucleic acid-binding protein